jgi:hypothetical protein
MTRVVAVQPLNDRKVRVELSNGRSGIFDVSPYLRTDYFRELLDEQYFSRVSIFFNGIGWPHGQDLSPDTIEDELVAGE